MIILPNLKGSAVSFSIILNNMYALYYCFYFLLVTIIIIISIFLLIYLAQTLINTYLHNAVKLRSFK